MFSVIDLLLAKRSFFFVLTIVVGCASSAFSDELTIKHQPTGPSISVSGSAEVQVEPDKALLQVAVESRAKELEKAVSENDLKIKEVIKFLRNSEIDPANLRTQTLEIEPLFNSDSKDGSNDQLDDLFDSPTTSTALTPIGYRVRRELAITITELAKCDSIYEGLMSRGVNEVNGLEFETSKLRKHRDEARLRAIRAAREKAEAMAGELGATLDSVRSIVESRSYDRGLMQNSLHFGGDPFGESADLMAAGTLKISASVQVVFDLGDVKLE